MIKRVRLSVIVDRTQPVSVEFPDRVIEFILIAGATQTVGVQVGKKVALTVFIDPEEV